jgi:hypothetical protein
MFPRNILTILKVSSFLCESCTVRVTGFSACTCRKCVPFVAYAILVANTHKKDETFKMVRILRGNIIYDHFFFYIYVGLTNVSDSPNMSDYVIFPQTRLTWLEGKRPPH